MPMSTKRVKSLSAAIARRIFAAGEGCCPHLGNVNRVAFMHGTDEDERTGGGLCEGAMRDIIAEVLKEQP